MLMQPTATKAMLGMRKKYDTGYIIGVMAHLQRSIHTPTAHAYIMTAH